MFEMRRERSYDQRLQETFKLEYTDLNQGERSVQNEKLPTINKDDKTIKYPTKLDQENRENKNKRKQTKRKDLPKEILSDVNSPKLKLSTASDIIIEGESIECLIDTGAQTSFISEAYFLKRGLKKDKITKRKNWITANGTPLKVTGQTTVDIKIGKESLKVVLIIAKSLAQNIIIGVDILKKNGFIVDFKKNTLKLKEETVLINSISQPIYQAIRAVKEIEIKPFHHYIYSAKIEDTNEKNILIEKSGKLEIVECIANIVNNTIKIHIENPTPEKRVIKKGTQLCKYSECEILTSIEKTEDLREFISNESEIEYINYISENKPWKPSEEVKLNNKGLNEEQKKLLSELIDKYWMCFSKNEEDVGAVSDNFGNKKRHPSNER